MKARPVSRRKSAPKKKPAPPPRKPAPKRKTGQNLTLPRARGKAGPKAVNWRPAFLKALRFSGGSVQAACDAAGISRTVVYEVREKSPAFALAWEDAREAAADDAEALLFDLAMGRVKKPVWYKGERVGTDAEQYEGSLHKYLEGRRRSTWGQKRELTGKDGAPLRVDSAASLEALSDEDLNALRHRLDELKG